MKEVALGALLEVVSDAALPDQVLPGPAARLSIASVNQTGATACPTLGIAERSGAYVERCGGRRHSTGRVGSMSAHWAHLAGHAPPAAPHADLMARADDTELDRLAPVEPEVAGPDHDVTLPGCRVRSPSSRSRSRATSSGWRLRYPA